MTQTQPQMDEAYDWRGRTVVDSDGQKIGSLNEVYLDEETSRLEWALVNTACSGPSRASYHSRAGARRPGRPRAVHEGTGEGRAPR
jgi:PRC-barrel domain